MKIWMIWARDDEVHWLVAAWDEDSQAENYGDWEDELAAAYAEHGSDNVRVLMTTIDLKTVALAYEAARVGNTGLTKGNA